MPKRRILLGCLLLWTVFSGCWSEPEWTDLRRDATDCVVAVFPPEATIQEINGFLKEHTEASVAPRGGQPLRPSIGAVIKRGIDNKTAYEICFRPDADPAEVNAIREEIKASPVVERVLEGKQADEAIYGDRH